MTSLKERILCTPGRPRAVAEALGTTRQYVRASRARARQEGQEGALREIYREYTKADNRDLRFWLLDLYERKRGDPVNWATPHQSATDRS
jgi:hypothetical protein